ncbi:transcription factor tfb4 [Ceratocystis lukuohia]|uniref:General transcription and DNA repair factor IIH subunit TFB4 n=3 Tax=Ceratocystis TaxID=5157 RepID=A0A0F8B5E7_CERFI|nr:RNA polymerase II transcription factor B subunit 4 [Ceratocystis platani]PHH55353.1 RNA polymerase II transcription factor B subunit 4 [Ceratocystis fimbriata CBS 114723]
MNAVDASDHFEASGNNTDSTASILAIIIDTNPRAWAALNDSLPLSKAIANILVYLNAHMAIGTANQVAVIASHTNCASWLYPQPQSPSSTPLESDGDVAMQDVQFPPNINRAHKEAALIHVENTVISSYEKLVANTTEADISCTTTQLSGALTLALNYINRVFLNVNAAKAGPADEESTKASSKARISGRILVVSVSDSEPSQYIPTMNAVFAAAHSSISIDTLALCGDATLLQQAGFITNGTFLRAPEPRGFLQYLMVGFTSDNEIALRLIPPSHNTVDFRAACFCHGRVVDTGFVCSICLSIFCEVPPDSECLTCGTVLQIGSYGVKPAVVPRKKKKKKKALTNGASTPVASGGAREDTGSATPRG